MKTSKRYLHEMANMYGLTNELYTMKRGMKIDGELRYDITEIPAMKINGQYNKTKGHIHSTGHQELYEVLEGHAYFLFLAENDFYYVDCSKGEFVIVPGDYFHVTINVGNKTLKLGNWINEKCQSDYKYMERMNGMPWYLNDKWFKNPMYNEYPEIRREQALQKAPKDLSFLYGFSHLSFKTT